MTTKKKTTPQGAKFNITNPDELNALIEVYGTHSLFIVLKSFGFLKENHQDAIPKKYNKFIDDIIVTRIILTTGTLTKNGNLFITKANLRKMNEAIQIHIMDKIAVYFHKKNQTTLFDVYKGFLNEARV